MFDTEAAEIGTARYFTPPAWLSLTTKQRADVGAVIKISRQGRIAESAAIVPIRWQDVNAAIEAFQFLCLPDSPVMPGTISTGAVVALVIDFKNFNDQQICEHFRAALPAFRLHAGSGEEPVRRGKKISDSRAALENLAIMRLRHSLTITEIKELLAGHPFKCWNEGERESDGPQQIREKADKRRERALKFFREHFPDLGPEATPEHWKTALEMGRA
jgi:hypothetical protein